MRLIRTLSPMEAAGPWDCWAAVIGSGFTGCSTCCLPPDNSITRRLSLGMPKVLFFLGIAMLGLCAASLRADEPLVFDLRYVKAAELIRTLTEMAKHAGVSLEFTTEGNRLGIRGGDEAMHRQLTEAVKENDAPCISVFSCFIKVSHVSVEKAAVFLNKALGYPDDESPVQVVPATRTGEIFAMGTVEDMELVKALLQAIDRAPTRPRFK